METTLKQIADLFEGEIRGDSDLRIKGIAGLREAGPGEISFLANLRYGSDLSTTRASAVILGRNASEHIFQSLKDRGISVIMAEDPYYGFAQCVGYFHTTPYQPIGISSPASVGKGVAMGKDISIHPFVRIENHAKIGDRTTVYSGTFIGEGSEIGDDCLIYPNVTIREKAKVGNRVILHSGVVIGSDGFGFATRKGKHHKIPQVGTVVIEDDVELGANVTVDRAAMGKTVIKRGTKVDNLVQIAHNVVVGEDSLIVAQAGISGSTELGHHVILAGQVGVVGHIRIGDEVRVGAQSGVVQDIPSGQTVSGTPTIPHQKWLRVQAVIKILPELNKKINELEKKLKDMEEVLGGREERL
jgi:UDP-3-O-[3-hydroxymyristoyl] glucosamine N-acyltransferase